MCCLCPCELAPAHGTPSGAARHYPDIRADGTYDQTKAAPDLNQSRNGNIVSLASSEHKGAGIVIR